jgi:hypothetical protein
MGFARLVLLPLVCFLLMGFGSGWETAYVGIAAVLAIAAAGIQWKRHRRATAAQISD